MASSETATIGCGFAATAVGSAVQKERKRESGKDRENTKKKEREVQRRLVDELVKVETSNTINGR